MDEDSGWVDFTDNEQPWTDHSSSPYYIPYLCVRDDESVPNEVTPAFRTSISLCSLSSFFRLISELYPNFHFYLDRFYEINVAAANDRMAHAIAILQKSQFLSGGGEFLNDYPVKVIYIYGSAESISSTIENLVRPAIVVCDGEDKRFFPKSIAWVLSYEEATPSRVLALIEQVARNAPSVQDLVNDRHGLLEPIVNVANHPDRFLFGESDLSELQSHDCRLTRPNERLANQLRRRLGTIQRHEADERFALMMTAFDAVQQRSAADRVLSHVNAGGEPASRELQKLAEVAIDSPTAEHIDEIDRADKEEFVDNSFILCVPCVHKHIPQQVYGRIIPDRVLNLLFEGKRRDYNTEVSLNRLKTDEEKVLAFGLIEAQALEIDYLTNMLTLWAQAERLPVIRLPQVPSGLFGKLKALKRIHQDGNVVAVNRAISQFGRDLADSVPPEFMDRLKYLKPRRILIWSDLPFEWLLLDEVPLMFHCEVNRIAITPGNFILTHYFNVKNDLQLGKAEASRLVVLNCLEEKDPLYKYAQIFRTLLQQSGKPFTFLNVRSRAEFEDALREQKPFILIHFGHGSYESSSENGYLHFGSEKTNVWELRNVAIPPVVMLGACETSAVADTYNNPANAFLGLGARAVLATFLPVEADRTIELFGRVLTNLWDSIDGEYSLGTWGRVISKTLTLNRYLDYLWAFRADQIRRGRSDLPSKLILEYAYRWRVSGFSSMADGYKQCTTIIRQAIAHFDEKMANDFDKFLARDVAVQHTMFFTSMGSPSTIKIVRSTPESTESNEAQDYWRNRGGFPIRTDGHEMS